jgi:MFS family permease
VPSDAVRMSARSAARASAVLYVLLALSAVAQTTIVPLLPIVRHHYGLNASALAWLLALPSVAMLVSATPLGILGDRIGNRHVTVAAGVVIALSVLAQGIPSLAALIVARLGFGAGYGALWTAGLAWLGDMQATGSSRRMAASSTASAAGSTIGPTLSGTLASHFGFAAPFVATGVVTTMVTGLLMTAPEPLGTGAARTSAPRPVTGRRLRHPFGRGMFAVLRHPLVLAGATTLALSTGVASLLQLLVPAQLHSSGHSAQEIGFVLSAGALAYVGMGAICVRVGPRITNARTNAWLAVLLAVALVPPLVGAGMGWVVAAVVASSLPRAAISTVAYALAADGRDPHGPGRGAVIGVLNSLWAAATVVVPVVAGGISAVDGPRSAYAAAAAATAATAVSLHRRARYAGTAARGLRHLRHAGTAPWRVSTRASHAACRPAAGRQADGDQSQT